MSAMGPGADRRVSSVKSWKRTFTHSKFVAGSGPERSLVSRATNVRFEPKLLILCIAANGGFRLFHQLSLVSFTNEEGWPHAFMQVQLPKMDIQAIYKRPRPHRPSANLNTYDPMFAGFDLGKTDRGQERQPRSTSTSVPILFVRVGVKLGNTEIDAGHPELSRFGECSLLKALLHPTPRTSIGSGRAANERRFRKRKVFRSTIPCEPQ